METIAQISLLVYAIVVAAGGIAGFVKAKSKASLIAGVVSGVLMLIAHIVSYMNMKTGLLCGVGVTSLLTIVFAIRLAKTKKFMPSGMLLILTVIEELFLLIATYFKM